MSASTASQTIELLVAVAHRVCELAKTAARNRKTLTGDNFYASKFHDATIELANVARRAKSAVKHLQVDSDELDLLAACQKVIADRMSDAAERREAFQEIKRICQTVFLPLVEASTADPEPATEQVLPMSVVTGTRKYIESVVRQANGCYEHQWYDACAVMIRRLVETLIIDYYVSKGREDEIRNKPGASGDFFMLGRLVEVILADRKVVLGRETKRGLPLLKSLGDRAAHNRHFNGKKADLDKVTPDLRVVADDLLNLAGLK